MTARLHGVDFSGAQQAGHNIWLATAVPDGDRLHVESVESAADRFGVAERAPCLGELSGFVRDATVVGMDFPFGVPAVVHGCETWESSVEWVTTTATDADEFQATCRGLARERTDGERADIQRETDVSVGGMCPYGGYVWKQTFHGIRDVLAPLAGTDDVCVRPMQTHSAPDATTLCEIYPAATLASLSLPAEKYKDGDEPAREHRQEIVDGLVAETRLELADGVRGQLINDAGGDALDAVVAALATDRARQSDFEPDREWHPAEGHIYV